MMNEYEILYTEYLERSIKAEKDKVELEIKTLGRPQTHLIPLSITVSRPPPRSLLHKLKAKAPAVCSCHRPSQYLKYLLALILIIAVALSGMWV
jgi:hypothetical protein